MLKLYDWFRSTASYRVRITLNLKSLQYDAIPIHLVNGEQHSNQYHQINSQGLVPALDEQGKIITQSLAIIEYLNEKYPTPPLLPEDLYLKSLVRGFALSIVADIHPLNNARVLKYLTNELNVSESQKMNWYHHWLQIGLSALETKLAQNKFRGKFCFGDEPTIADICLVPQLFNAKRFNCDTSSFPLLMEINEHCLTLDVFKNAQPLEVPEGVK